jgi:hypothetical protein
MISHETLGDHLLPLLIAIYVGFRNDLLRLCKTTALLRQQPRRRSTFALASRCSRLGRLEPSIHGGGETQRETGAVLNRDGKRVTPCLTCVWTSSLCPTAAVAPRLDAFATSAVYEHHLRLAPSTISDSRAFDVDTYLRGGD